MDNSTNTNKNQNKTNKYTTIPENIQELIDAGGLMSFAKKEIENQK
jgi:3-isopropylmalate/(R)-2-methylmalate dehydratase small subunit